MYGDLNVKRKFHQAAYRVVDEVRQAHCQSRHLRRGGRGANVVQGLRPALDGLGAEIERDEYMEQRDTAIAEVLGAAGQEQAHEDIGRGPGHSEQAQRLRR